MRPAQIAMLMLAGAFLWSAIAHVYRGAYHIALLSAIIVAVSVYASRDGR